MSKVSRGEKQLGATWTGLNSDDGEFEMLDQFCGGFQILSLRVIGTSLVSLSDKTRELRRH